MKKDHDTTLCSFVPLTGPDEDGWVTGAMCGEDGSNEMVSMRSLGEGEIPDPDGEVVEAMTLPGTSVIAVRRKKMPRRGWTPAYEGGWERIFGGETPEA